MLSFLQTLIVMDFGTAFTFLALCESILILLVFGKHQTLTITWLFAFLSFLFLCMLLTDVPLLGQMFQNSAQYVETRRLIIRFVCALMMSGFLVLLLFRRYE